MKILEYINANSNTLMVIITLVYAIATFFICKYNKQSADAARDALKKSFDMQLYDRMLLIASNIENNNYSNSKMEVSMLFSKNIWKQITEIKDTEDLLTSWEMKLKEYWKICEKFEGFDPKLMYEAQYEGAPDSIIKAEEEQSRNFSIISSGCPEMGIEPETYDQNEIYSNIEKLKKEISQKQENLKCEVYAILEEKISI